MEKTASVRVAFRRIPGLDSAMFQQITEAAKGEQGPVLPLDHPEDGLIGEEPGSPEVVVPDPFRPGVTPRRYLSRRGEELLARGNRAQNFFTATYLESGNEVLYRRIAAKALPLRKTLEEAQADLDAYAKANGLREVSGP